MLRLVALTFPLLALANLLQVLGQVSAVNTADVRREPEIVIEAKVLGIPAAGIAELGLVLPESASGTPGSPTGFAVVLPETEAQGLLEDSRTKAVHGLKLRGTPGNILKFSVDTRAQINPTSPVENPPYYEIGLVFEVTPSVFPSHNIALSTLSSLQIRRGPPPADGVVPLIFETPAIKHDIQIPEGKTILLGGFLTTTNSTGLPTVPAIEGNPIMDYVVSKSPRKGNETEIVVLLTPRVFGVVDDVKPPAPVVPIAPVLVSDSPTKLELPAAPPAAPPVQPKASPKVDERFYTLQVGAFGSSVNAEALVTELKKKFEVVFIDKATSTRTPYRVRVGRVPTLAAAKQLQTKLAEQGVDAYVVPPEAP